MSTLSPSISPSPSHVSNCWGYRGTCDMHAMCIQGQNGTLIPSPPSQLLSLSVRIMQRLFRVISTASNNSCEGGLGMRLVRQLVHAVYRMPGPDHHYIMIGPFHIYITIFIALNISPHILTSSFLTPHTHTPSHLTHTAEDMEYTLSDEFCRRHFLVGVLLREVRILLLSSAPPHPLPLPSSSPSPNLNSAQVES